MRCIVSLLVALVLVLLASCKNNNLDSNAVQARQTEQLMSEVQRQIGLPNIVNFQQKKIMKMILEECDKENLLCFVYLKSDYTGKLVFIGQSVGYGVPFSAQYTNPEKILEGDKQVGYDITGLGTLMTLPQADPNGLYMPTSSSATWLLMIDPNNKPRLVYLEPEIVVSPFKLPTD